MVTGNSEGVRGSQKPKFLRMKLNWNFWRDGGGKGGGAKLKNDPWGRYGYFLVQYNLSGFSAYFWTVRDSHVVVKLVLSASDSVYVRHMQTADLQTCRLNRLTFPNSFLN